MDTHITDILRNAVDGLLYMSESDEPFEVVEWPGTGKPIDAPRLLEITSNPPGTPVSTISLDEFFKPLISEKSWYGDAERVTAQRYRELDAVLKQNLSDIRVFRVGEVEVAVYIIGLTPSGNWAGLRTKAIET